MVMGNCNGNGDGNGDGNRVSDRDGNGDGNGNGHGKGDHYKGRVASSCGGNVQCFWMGDTLPPPPWIQGKCIHQCCIMGVTLLRVFAPLQGGGFLTAHHGFFFCLFFTTAVQFTEQPSVCPPHQVIAALPPPLLQEPRQPIDHLPRLLLHFCQGKPKQGLQVL